MIENAAHKIIAIDGPAASGKGTLAIGIAKALGFAHMDTGALYRAVAFEIEEANLRLAFELQALKACDVLEEKLRGGGSAAQILGNPLLRTDIVAALASKVATLNPVRARLIDVQRNFAINPPNAASGAVLDGRDIGTVICPQAGLKLFVTANLEIRAQRRKKELHSKGINATYEAVLEDMRARDARDSSRKAAPLRPAQDAIVIDSSDLSAAQMLDLALGYAIKAFALNSSSGA